MRLLVCAGGRLELKASKLEEAFPSSRSSVSYTSIEGRTAGLDAKHSRECFRFRVGNPCSMTLRHDK